MEADELLKKLRVLEDGHAEIKRRLMPERRGAQAAVRRRACRALPPQQSSSSRRVAARGRLSDRYCHWILQSLGQAVHIIAPDGKLLYWNRYAEDMYGYSVAEAVGQNAVELIVHPADYDSAKIVIQNIFMGKCWRGKFPVKNKSGERFFISVHNTPLYDDDGSLVGLICLSLDVRTLEEIYSPSGSAESYPSTAMPQFHANNRPESDSPNTDSLHSRQPLQSAITSKIVTLATKVTSRVRSRIRTGQNCDEQYDSGCEGQYSELDVRVELSSSEASTSSGDVMPGAFFVEMKSPSKSTKTSNEGSGEGKVRFHKMFSSKAEALLARNGSWPWKGRENDGGSGKNSMKLAQLHNKPENDQSH
uniref:Uncharacterized protein n=1 Tax=Avena sativa TaxID=4498 RepID=A0ACD5ZD47_AVESA